MLIGEQPHQLTMAIATEVVRGLPARLIPCGVLARSEAGVALHALSNSNRAGVFQSGGVVAQINLVPIQQDTLRTELPEDGEVAIYCSLGTRSTRTQTTYFRART